MASTEIYKNKLGYIALTPQQFKEEITAAVNGVSDAIALVKKVESPRWDTVILPLETASERLDRVWHLLDHVNSVQNTPDIRDVHDDLLPLVTNLHSELFQDVELYDCIMKVKNSPAFSSLNKGKQAVIEHSLRSFRLGGVNLDNVSRAKLKELNEQLSLLTSKFANNVLDATQSWSYHVTTAQKVLLDGLPERLIEAAKENAAKDGKTGWLLKLNTPTYIDVISYAKNRQLREEFYNAYYTRASDQGLTPVEYDNTQIIADILKLRQEIAHITGYENYAAFSLVPKMAESTKAVNDFLESLVAKVLPYARAEYAELQKFAREQGFAQEMQPWDIGFYAERMREQKYQINEEELRVYFPEDKVLAGLFDLASKLYNIKFEEVENIEAWHETVRMFKVTDAFGELRGYFYIDLYAREGKRGGAWMSECVSRMTLKDGKSQTSIAFLNCNFPAPQGSQKALLAHNDVVTLFHEFGHTMHHVLTQVDEYSVSGIKGVEWDAVELPSQLMENWAWEWDVIQNITQNIHNNEPMPREIFNKLLASKNFQSGLFLIRQLIFALFDFRVHENTDKDKGKSAHDVLQDLRKEINVTPVTANNRFENAFSHIFAGGYDAGYYSYLWAEVLSCDAYEKFIERKLIDAEVGAEFLSKFLEKGGSMPAMDLFTSFLGRKPNVEALLRHHALMEEHTREHSCK